MVEVVKNLFLEIFCKVKSLNLNVKKIFNKNLKTLLSIFLAFLNPD